MSTPSKPKICPGPKPKEAPVSCPVPKPKEIVVYF